MPLITIVEDDPRIRQSLRTALQDLGYAVRAAATAMEALHEVSTEPGDLLILDLGLPDLDGRDLLKMVRAVTSVPVIIATARDEEEEIIRTLDLGADEYVVKPFSVNQLDARIRALLRRSTNDPIQGVITIGELVIDSAARRSSLRGRQLNLTRKEFDVLHHLAKKRGRVVTKRELLAEVWRQPFGGEDRTVDVHLSWLRRKLGESAANPRYLRVVRGVGAQLVDPGTDL